MDSIKKYKEISMVVKKYDIEIEKALYELDGIKTEIMESDANDLDNLLLGFKAWFNYIKQSPNCSIYATVSAFEIVMGILEKYPELDKYLRDLLFDDNTKDIDDSLEFIKRDEINKDDKIGSREINTNNVLMKKYNSDYSKKMIGKEEVFLKNIIDNLDEVITVESLKNDKLLYEIKLYLEFLYDKLHLKKESYDEYQYLRLENILKKQLSKIDFFIDFYEKKDFIVSNKR